MILYARIRRIPLFVLRSRCGILTVLLPSAKPLNWRKERGAYTLLSQKNGGPPERGPPGLI